MKAVNKLLNAADQALKTTKIVSNSGKVEEVNKGYISGFGPSVISSGLIPALAFYLSDANKSPIIDAIAQTLSPGNSSSVTNSGHILFRAVLQLENNRMQLNLEKERIINASIALKIMMRTYDFIKTQNSANV